ncbi:hypothetical protein GCM10010350_79000 [Streptomyces galilaeus]|nr:hypothetical protein GCM10010350_79000 [Streptomyces galilaeus]
MQAWEQRALSKIRFSGLRARTWSPDGGYSETKSYNADVYVFAVQTAREHTVYEPLDTTQWEFYVLPRRSRHPRLGQPQPGRGSRGRQSPSVPHRP